MHLNHPETIASVHVWSIEKLSSMKLVPAAKKFEDNCSKKTSQYCY